MAAALKAVCVGKDGTQFEHRLPVPALQTGSLGFMVYLPPGYSTASQVPRSPPPAIAARVLAPPHVPDCSTRGARAESPPPALQDWPVIFHLHGGGEGELQSGEGELTECAPSTAAGRFLNYPEIPH